MAFGAAFTISGVMDFKMFTLVWVSSIRVWPGFLAIPEVIITISESLASSYSPAMLEYVRTSGGQVIANKGATFYAVSVAVCKLVATILSSSDSVATVSSMMHGEYGIEDVCLSTLTLVGPKGVQGKIPMRMTKEVVEKLKASADALKAVIEQIEH